MRHIDEHTLELFVLNAKEIRGKRRSIKNHLTRCVGCREVVQRLKDIYSDVGAELSRGQDVVSALDRQIVRVPQSLSEWLPSGELWNEPIHDVSEYIDSGEEASAVELARFREVGLPALWKRMNFFRREHPVVSSSFGFALLASIVLIRVYLFNNVGNPSYYRYNTDAGRLDVYSSTNKLLWSMPASRLDEAKKDEATMNISYTVVTDLNGDGKNEVISSILLGNEQPPSALKIFDSKGNLLRKLAFLGMTMNFRGVQYDQPTMAIHGTMWVVICRK